MKIKLALSTGAVALADVLRSEREAAKKALEEYTALRDGAEGAELAWLLHLDRLIHITEAEICWLDQAEERARDLPAASTHLLDGMPDTPSVPTQGINP